MGGFPVAGATCRPWQSILTMWVLLGRLGVFPSRSSSPLLVDCCRRPPPLLLLLLATNRRLLALPLPSKKELTDLDDLDKDFLDDP